MALVSDRKMVIERRLAQLQKEIEVCISDMWCSQALEYYSLSNIPTKQYM